MIKVPLSRNLASLSCDFWQELRRAAIASEGERKLDNFNTRCHTAWPLLVYEETLSCPGSCFTLRTDLRIDVRMRQGYFECRWLTVFAYIQKHLIVLASFVAPKVINMPKPENVLVLELSQIQILGLLR